MRKSELRGRLAVAAAVLSPALTMGLSLSSFSLLVVPWTEAFDVSRATIMGALAVATIGMTLASPLVGWLIVKLTPRVVVVLGAALLTAGLLLAANATSFPMVALAYIAPIALGVVFAGALPAMTVAIGHYPERAGSLSGLIGLGTSLLGAAAPILAANLMVMFGWRMMLQISAVTVFVLVLPIAWFMLVARVVPATGDVGEASQSAGGWTAADTLRRPAFWLIIAGVLPIMLALIAIQSNLAVIADDAKLSPKVAGYLVAIVAGGAALGAVVVGWLADRIDARIIYTAAAALIASRCSSWSGPAPLAATPSRWRPLASRRAAQGR
ncbi:MFS transporter [uncultured Phenylobacterium sp.]|uniref:MFS transporter n=1 Tax=uncultured Phenylobacterium sp. TaxID=349273 RepID=UPI0026008665|nr:MFS transporter [uncultured Phenylobacterium sp.]